MMMVKFRDFLWIWYFCPHEKKKWRYPPWDSISFIHFQNLNTKIKSCTFVFITRSVKENSNQYESFHELSNEIWYLIFCFQTIYKLHPLGLHKISSLEYDFASSSYVPFCVNIYFGVAVFFLNFEAGVLQDWFRSDHRALWLRNMFLALIPLNVFMYTNLKYFMP